MHRQHHHRRRHLCRKSKCHTIKMSDNIPIEIQMEIIQRIPNIKSVIQYRSVSKAWKSFIDSKEFVTDHTRRHIQQQPRHLLIRGQYFDDFEVKYESIVDDDTFPHQKVTLSVPRICQDARLVGSSHGLICLYDYTRKLVVIWNPLIRKTVFTVLPDDKSKQCCIEVGFGICPNTLDPKLVKIRYNEGYANISTQVEVFTFSSRVWRSPLSNTCPRKSIGFGRSQTVVDGFLYWSATDEIIVDDVRTDDTLIISFDLTSEEFTELYLPNPPRGDFYVSNLWESLGVFEFDRDTHPENYYLWIMKGQGCTRSFEKLYDISTFDVSIWMILEFRRSGAPFVELQYDVEDEESPATLAVYDPESKEITEIWRNSGYIPCAFLYGNSSFA